MFTFFTNPLCLKQDDFKVTLRGERKGSKDYIKVNLLAYSIWCILSFSNQAFRDQVITS